MPEKIIMTQEEFDQAIKVGVLESQVSILINDFQEHKVHGEAELKEIKKSVDGVFNLLRNFPEQIVQCRDELEKDIHAELEKHYVTDKNFKLMEASVNNKIDKITNKFKWTTGIIVAVAGTIQFFAMMWYMGLQISKLAG